MVPSSKNPSGKSSRSFSSTPSGSNKTKGMGKRSASFGYQSRFRRAKFGKGQASKSQISSKEKTAPIEKKELIRKKAAAAHWLPHSKSTTASNIGEGFSTLRPDAPTDASVNAGFEDHNVPEWLLETYATLPSQHPMRKILPDQHHPPTVDPFEVRKGGEAAYDYLIPMSPMSEEDTRSGSTYMLDEHDYASQRGLDFQTLAQLPSNSLPFCSPGPSAWSSFRLLDNHPRPLLEIVQSPTTDIRRTFTHPRTPQLGLLGSILPPAPPVPRTPAPLYHPSPRRLLFPSLIENSSGETQAEKLPVRQASYLDPTPPFSPYGSLDVFLAPEIASSPFDIAMPLGSVPQASDPHGMPRHPDDMVDLNDAPSSSPVLQFLYKRPHASALKPLITKAPTSDPYHKKLLRFVDEMQAELVYSPPIFSSMWDENEYENDTTTLQGEDVFSNRLGVEDSPRDMGFSAWGSSPPHPTGSVMGDYLLQGSSPVMKEGVFTE